MSLLTQCIYVGLGGLIGSISRYLVLISVSGFSLFGSHGLASVNMIGSFMAGFLLPWIAGSDHWRLLVGVGFLGSLTTISAFSTEAIEMLRDEKITFGIVFIFSHAIVCILLCALGLALGTRIKV